MRSTLFAFVAVASFALSASAQETSSVSVVHGIPGVTVDVYVNGGLTLPSFAPGTVAGPLDLPAGSYRIQIVAAGETDLSKAVIDQTAEVPGGNSLSVVAHLSAEGAPQLSAFVNDLSSTGADRGRIIVRHVAAAPKVNVLLLKGWRNRALLKNLSNGDEGAANVPEGTYTAYVLAAKSYWKSVASFQVPVEAEKATIAYAIGSLEAGTFGVVSQSLSTAPPPAKVTVVHGVPGLTVDVFVNGALALPNFEPKTITDPIELPAGKYAIAIAPAGAGIEAAVIEAEVEVTSGLQASIVAHLDASGAPTASVFVDDLSFPSWQKGRVVVRHTAAAPAVDVVLTRGGKPAGKLTGIENGKEASAELRYGLYRASVYPAGGDAVVLGPANLTVLPRAVTTIYAIGSLENGTLELLKSTRRISIHRCVMERLHR